MEGKKWNGWKAVCEISGRQKVKEVEECLWNFQFIKYKNKEYLISVGVSNIANSSVIARINAIKAAKALAQRDLTKFIHRVKITSQEELKSITIITKDGEKITRKYDEKFIEIIREESGGILREILEIGKWKRDGEYFFALGIEKKWNTI